ncbi:uncharacterized protein [Callorhinus ursinus]|uniref:uncharacterized protein isoform X1 n=1 Tax=Callorhinus ursinus TaxID=34884 RepID=UPI003CCFF93C
MEICFLDSVSFLTLCSSSDLGNLIETMEPNTSALSRPCLDLHASPVEFHEINTEFCDESITYSEVRAHGSSSIEKRKTTSKLKMNESPWCPVAILFTFLYLIFLGLAAIMTAKVHCLEGVLMTHETAKQNDTTYCKII